MIDKRQLGERLQVLRIRAGLTQGAVAREAGVAWDSVRSWEAGRAVPTALNLARVCAVLRKHGEEKAYASIVLGEMG